MNAHVKKPTQADIDAALECEILAAYDAMVDPKKTDDESRAHWFEMRALIAKRSPRQVRRMDFERGLAQLATFEPREDRRI
jgi:hypothetical protein